MQKRMQKLTPLIKTMFNTISFSKIYSAVNLLITIKMFLNLLTSQLIIIIIKFAIPAVLSQE